MILEESKEQKKKGNSERRKTILTSLYDEVGTEKKGKRKSRRKKRVADVFSLLLFCLVAIYAVLSVKDWLSGRTSTRTSTPNHQDSLIIANLSKHTIDEENRGGDCPICLSEFEVGETATKLPCEGKHKFHTECIGQWLKMQNTCPSCRATINNSSIRRANAQGQPQQLPRCK
ncbi:hypothetical protein niasHS_015363 [Heterodera schachtii]|uniref:RING-type domain-containing protein n=1 Tax=Heterodera schachtii TaxID=97005 RepID=A0ABD2I5X6_HETSC